MMPLSCHAAVMLGRVVEGYMTSLALLGGDFEISKRNETSFLFLLLLAFLRTFDLLFFYVSFVNFFATLYNDFATL